MAVESKKEQLKFLFKTLVESKTPEGFIKNSSKIKDFVRKNKNLAEEALVNFPTAIGRIKAEKKFFKESQSALFKEVVPVLFDVARQHLTFCEEKCLERSEIRNDFFNLQERLFMTSCNVNNVAYLKLY